jgi:hypothetical protein
MDVFLTGCGDGCVFKNKAYPFFSRVESTAGGDFFPEEKSTRLI